MAAHASGYCSRVETSSASWSAAAASPSSSCTFFSLASFPRPCRRPASLRHRRWPPDRSRLKPTPWEIARACRSGARHGKRPPRAAKWKRGRARLPGGQLLLRAGHVESRPPPSGWDRPSCRSAPAPAGKPPAPARTAGSRSRRPPPSSGAPAWRRRALASWPRGPPLPCRIPSPRRGPPRPRRGKTGPRRPAHADERRLALLGRRALAVVLHLGRPAVDRGLDLLEREAVPRGPFAKVGVETDLAGVWIVANLLPRPRHHSRDQRLDRRRREEPLGANGDQLQLQEVLVGIRRDPCRAARGGQSRYPSLSASIVSASPGFISGGRISQKRPSSSVDGASFAPRTWTTASGDRMGFPGPIGRCHHDPFEIASVGRAGLLRRRQERRRQSAAQVIVNGDRPKESRWRFTLRTSLETLAHASMLSRPNAAAVIGITATRFQDHGGVARCAAALQIGACHRSRARYRRTR